MIAGQVEFVPLGIRFARYPFPGATVHPAGLVNYHLVRDADPGAAPPEIRLRTGETLFLPAADRERLEAELAARSIPVVRRPPVWSALLEPFLDTGFTTANERRATGLLDRAGFSAEEVEGIRTRVGPAMQAYNALHQDWVDLGHADLLCACLQQGPAACMAMYWPSMHIAERTG